MMINTKFSIQLRKGINEHTRMKDGWIPHKPKVLLQLRSHILCHLPWQCHQVNKTSRMVLHCHYPAHHFSVDVSPPDGPHIDQVNLKAIPELRRYDGLPRSLLLVQATILLVANRTIINEQFHCTCHVIEAMPAACGHFSPHRMQVYRAAGMY